MFFNRLGLFWETKKTYNRKRIETSLSLFSYDFYLSLLKLKGSSFKIFFGHEKIEINLYQQASANI